MKTCMHEQPLAVAEQKKRGTIAARLTESMPRKYRSYLMATFAVVHACGRGLTSSSVALATPQSRMVWLALACSIAVNTCDLSPRLVMLCPMPGC